jgi:chaperonin GroES
MASRFPTVVDTYSDDPADADPNRVSLDDALEVIEEEGGTDALPMTSAAKLRTMAQASGDISHALPAEKLTEIGEQCVADYERDKRDRKEWEAVAREALDACAQEEKDEAKSFPWQGASNMKWPLLTIAAMQFNARMYPAIVKGDEAVLVKVIGQDNGKPMMGPNPETGEIQPIPAMGPDGQVAQPLQPQWEVPPGAKTARARRVSEYMNTTIFYRMETWEDDTDALLMQLPAVGCVFRKVFMGPRGVDSKTVSALNLVVPPNTRNVLSALRITEEIENVYPFEITEKQLGGAYRAIDLALDARAENDGKRLLLEQHCRWDMDGDGVDEPYIVTLDHETRQVLRIEPNFGLEDVVWATDGETPIAVRPRQYYVKYGMFPHPKGGFYDIGLGHLLKRLGDVINTAVNQLLDAGTAQTAGGGFIGSGVRLQSRGARGVVRFTPGEYKTVDVPGDQLRNAIVEKTLPNVSPVTFQILDLIMGAARDIAGIKDVMTGEASNTGQVGTTLALIEQGLQVFNSCAKRVFRSLKAEFELLFGNLSMFGGDLVARDYEETLDDPAANFDEDFKLEGLDIRPVSDPASITRMQKMAKAQFLLSLLPQIQAVGGDPRNAIERVLEAADVEDIEKILPPPPPPDPMAQQVQQEQIMLTLRGMAAKASKDEADALNKVMDAMREKFELSKDAGAMGMQLGATAAASQSPIPVYDPNYPNTGIER